MLNNEHFHQINQVHLDFTYFTDYKVNKKTKTTVYMVVFSDGSFEGKKESKVHYF